MDNLIMHDILIIMHVRLHGSAVDFGEDSCRVYLPKVRNVTYPITNPAGF